MIDSIAKLKDYIREEAKYYPSQQRIINRITSLFLTTPISNQYYVWKYIKTMRYYEFCKNSSFFVVRGGLKLYYAYRLNRYSYKTGFQIAPGSIGKGLKIWHWGPIIVHSDARIGKNCTLQPNIVIGKRKVNGRLPIIGDNVYICSGAKVLGDIRIGNDVTIAPNTVVFKDVPSNCVVAGNPAVIIKKDGRKVNIPL